MANPVSPTVNRRTTLKDALSMMLDADVQTGIVVDRNGAVQGLLTVEAVAQKMREGEHAPTYDQAAADGPDDAAGPPSEADLGGRRVRDRQGSGKLRDGHLGRLELGLRPLRRDVDALPPASPAGR